MDSRLAFDANTGSSWWGWRVLGGSFPALSPSLK